jgi:hypothetical protein
VKRFYFRSFEAVTDTQPRQKLPKVLYIALR